MSFNVRLKRGQNATGTTGIAGATGTVVTGNPVTMANVAPHSLSALVTLTVETNTVTLTPKWQCSDDGSTWYDVQGNTGTTRTGNSTPATTSEVVSLSRGIAWRYARLAVTVGGTTAVVNKEFYAISYTYLSPEFV